MTLYAGSELARQPCVGTSTVNLVKPLINWITGAKPSKEAAYRLVRTSHIRNLVCVDFEKQTETKLSWVKDLFYVTIASMMTGEGREGGVIGAELSIVAASLPHIGAELSMWGTQGGWACGTQHSLGPSPYFPMTTVH